MARKQNLQSLTSLTPQECNLEEGRGVNSIKCYREVTEKDTNLMT